MTRALIFLAVLFVAVFAFAQFLRRTGMFFPDRFPVGRWDASQYAVAPTEHFIRTPDNVRLHAWLFRASQTGAPLIVWCHGNAGNLTDRADMAAELARRGVSVLLFDWRGFGKSEGRVSESALYADALAAYDFARTLGARSVAMYGESIGGPYAAWVAKERKDVRAVILENSFPSLKDLGNALYRPLPLGYAAPFAMRTTRWLNASKAKVLVLHGTRDQVIPYALGQKLYRDLRVEKVFFSSHAGHCEIPLFEADRYYEAVTAFVQ